MINKSVWTFVRLLLIFLWFSIGINAQGFIESIEINSEEPNGALVLDKVEDGFVICGLYFDSTINRWTGYYSEFDQVGSRKFILIERLDTLVQLSNNGSLLNTPNGFQALGGFQDSLYFFKYDQEDSTISKSNFLSKSEHDFIGNGVFLKHDTVLICGRNYLEDNLDRDVKVLMIENDSIKEFNEFDTLSRNLALNIGVNSKNEIIVSCLNSTDANSDESYLIFFDSELNKIRSTKDFNSLSNMRLNYGFLIDSNDNIIISGEQREVVIGGLPNSFPCISKFDPMGNHLWTRRIGRNINNIQSLGKWNNVIESIDGQGYIIAGSTSYQNVDTIIAKATIAKINYDGEEVWYNEYVYDSTSHRIAEDITDIIALENGYAACGMSTNYIADPLRPWLKSIIIKVDENGELDTITSITNLIESVDPVYVYPNPVSDYLYIQNLDNVIERINIFDSRGVMVMSIKNFQLEEIKRIDLSNYNSGPYFLEITKDDESRSIQKLIIKK